MSDATTFDELAQPSLDERARQSFVSELRRIILVDYAKDLEGLYRKKVEPAVEKETGQAPQDHREIRRAISREPFYQFWSSMKYAAQIMTWRSVIPQIERHSETLNARAAEAERAHNEVGGTLKLNSEIDVPKAVKALDTHLAPGGYMFERSEGDVAAGAIYKYGTAVFSGGLTYAGWGDVGRSVAHFIKERHPEMQPRKILDVGCTIASNLLTWSDAFPDAELYGVDVSAPLLRYAHARAQDYGIKAHFSQQNAETLDFEDNTFDVVFTSFFFHEVAVNSSKRILSEIHRVLKPGGVTLNMELPPNSEVDPYRAFYLDWDGYALHEPHYIAYRDQSPKEMITGAGFSEESYEQHLVPNYNFTDPDEFRAAALKERPISKTGNGTSWFVYGGVKS